jgi:hypothetical protein
MNGMTDYSLMPGTVPMGQGLRPSYARPGPSLAGPQLQQPLPQQPMAPFAPAMQPPPLPPQGLDPDLVQLMLSMGRFTPQQAAMERQQLLADKLRAGAPALMQSQSSIHTPNWAGALASVVQQYRAGQMDREAQQGMQDLAAQKAKGYEQFFRALQGQRPSASDSGGNAYVP